MADFKDIQQSIIGLAPHNRGQMVDIMLDRAKNDREGVVEIIDEPIKVVEQYTKVSVPCVGTNFDCVLAEVFSPTNFFVILEQHLKELHGFYDKMQEFYSNAENVKKYKMRAGHIVVTIPVVIYYQDAYQFTRGIISEILTKKCVRVFCVDYGNICTISQDQLWYCNRRFFSFPIQGIYAKLHNIKAPISSRPWPQKTTKIFKELIENKILSARIEKDAGTVNDAIEVSLMDNKYKVKVCIRDRLIHMRLGFPSIVISLPKYQVLKKSKESLLDEILSNTAPHEIGIDKLCPTSLNDSNLSLQGTIYNEQLDESLFQPKISSQNWSTEALSSYTDEHHRGNNSFTLEQLLSLRDYKQTNDQPQKMVTFSDSQLDLTSDNSFQNSPLPRTNVHQDFVKVSNDPTIFPVRPSSTFTPIQTDLLQSFNVQNIIPNTSENMSSYPINKPVNPAVSSNICAYPMSKPAIPVCQQDLFKTLDHQNISNFKPSPATVIRRLPPNYFDQNQNVLSSISANITSDPISKAVAAIPQQGLFKTSEIKTIPRIKPSLAIPIQKLTPNFYDQNQNILCSTSEKFSHPLSLGEENVFKTTDLQNIPSNKSYPASPICELTPIYSDQNQHDVLPFTSTNTSSNSIHEASISLQSAFEILLEKRENILVSLSDSTNMDECGMDLHFLSLRAINQVVNKVKEAKEDSQRIVDNFPIK